MLYSECFSFRVLSFFVQLTFSEPPVLHGATASEFEVEPVQGRKVSKVVKTTVVRGERMEKQIGDPSLAADLPSAREDFEKVSVFKLDKEKVSSVCQSSFSL